MCTFIDCCLATVSSRGHMMGSLVDYHGISWVLGIISLGQLFHLLREHFNNEFCLAMECFGGHLLLIYGYFFRCYFLYMDYCHVELIEI